MKIKQFEIWIADLNPRIGKEPGKVRPVVVVQTELLNTQHPSTVICPITTKIERDSEILHLHIKKGSCGLKEPSDVMLDQVRAIDNSRLVKKVGALPHDLSGKLKDNLKILFDVE
jgi:mRNA interferase MazF